MLSVFPAAAVRRGQASTRACAAQACRSAELAPILGARQARLGYSSERDAAFVARRWMRSRCAQRHLKTSFFLPNSGATTFAVSPSSGMRACAFIVFCVQDWLRPFSEFLIETQSPALRREVRRLPLLCPRRRVARSLSLLSLTHAAHTSCDSCRSGPR